MELRNIFMLTAISLGFIKLSKFLFNISQWIYITFFRSRKNLKQYGSWALITGSTDGIGKALAFQLASTGLNLILVGRNPLKLQSTSEEIKHKHSTIAIKTVVIDFSRCTGDEIARLIDEQTRGLDLGILINNAGLSYPHPMFFHEVDLQVIESLLRVNLEAITRVTKTVIRRLMEKKKGVIVNIGSGSSACFHSYPLFAIYTATKGYVSMLSKSISLEYKQHGIDVQCQTPLLVATNMLPMKESSFFIPSPETYSKASMRWIGHSQQICNPYWPHALQGAIASVFPETFVDWCLLKFFVRVRAQVLQSVSKTGGHSKDHEM